MGSGKEEVGIELFELSELDFFKNKVKKVVFGANITDESKLIFRDNKIESKIRSVEFIGASVGFLEGNTIISKRSCIIFNQESSGQLKNNWFAGENIIEFKGMSEAELSGNFLKFKSCGIIQKEQSHIKAFNNKLRAYGEEAVGLKLSGMGESEMNRNKLNNMYIGAICSEASKLNFTENEVESKLKGICFSGMSEGIIYKNSLDTKEICLSYCGESSGEIKENSITAGTGLFINGLAQVKVAENIIKCMRENIKIEDQTKGIIKKNKLKSLRNKFSAGIVMSGSAEFYILENKFSGLSDAIRLMNQTISHIEKNVIKSSVYGLKIESGSEAHIKNNRIYETEYGIYYNSRVSYVNISSNYYRKNLKNKIDTVSLQKKKIFNTGARKEEMKNKTREWVIKNGKIFRFYYYLALYSFSFVLKKIFCTDIYLRRGMLLTDWHPGVSDIDLFILFKRRKSVVREKKFIKKIIFARSIFKIFFPFIGEIHISTLKELKNYIKFGGIRSYEGSLGWKPLLGSKKIKEKYAYDQIKFKFDCAAEILNLWQGCCGVYFNEEKTLNNSLKFLKAVIDILKYSYYIKKGDIKFSFISRTQIVDEVISDADVRAGLQNILSQIKNSWEKHEFNIELHEPVFICIFLYISDIFETLIKETDMHAVIYGDKFEKSVYKNLKKAQADLWGLGEEIYSKTEEKPLKIVQNKPGLFYVVIDNKITRQRLLPFIKHIAFVKNKSFSKSTKILLITETIYEVMLNLIHLDSPFNAYFPDTNEKGTYVSEYDSFQRYIGNSGAVKEINAYEGLLNTRVREAIVNISVSYRIEKMLKIDPGLYKSYFLSSLLAINIYLRRKELVVPPVMENIFRYMDSNNMKIPCSKFLRRKKLDNYNDISKIIYKMNNSSIFRNI